MPKTRLIAVGLLAAAILTGVVWTNMRGDPTEVAAQTPTAAPTGPVQSLSLFGTIPIYWGEASSMEDMLSGSGEPHWSRAVLEQKYSLTPIDTLDEASLRDTKRLLLAQPRALSPQENVALDNWVRQGGQLLLFADPMMTGHSQFGLGDKRRPQDVALLSPILARWGIALEFDPDQPEGVALVAGVGEGTPTNLSGRLVAKADSEGPDTDCELISERLIAQCTIGSGSAVILADAAVFDQPLFATPLLQLTAAAFPSE